jgi:hypothetical protein
VYKGLRDILNSGGNTPFEACRQYVDAFESAARDTNLPSSLLASIAMQESSCRADVTGRAGEIGLMQVTGEKCPSDGSNCYDPWVSIAVPSPVCFIGSADLSPSLIRPTFTLVPVT